jgi:hypothetical protein
MQKPNGYDEAQAMGDYTPVELGGHHLIIKGVKEQNTKNGDPMIVVAFDFAKNDKQPGYFSDMFERDIRPDKKWPNAGTMYILTQDYADKTKTSSTFKGFVTSFERSNNVNAIWGEKFCDQFVGKKIGGVFGIVEEEYNGEVKKRHKLRWFCEDGRADSANIPKEKLLKKTSSSSADYSDFQNIPEGTNEEVPF